MPSDAHEPISVTVTPAFADYLRLNLRFVFRSPLILIAGLLPLFAVLFQLLMPGIQLGLNDVVRLLPVLIFPTLFFVVIPLSIYRAAKRRWRDSSELREERTYTFTEAGIQVTGATFAAFVAWSHIVAARRTGDLVTLRTGQQLFYLIPVWAFESDAIWERFCQLVEAKVNDTRLA
jgi:hypothetical protein